MTKIMLPGHLCLPALLLLLTSCSMLTPETPGAGGFDLENDLLLAQFDSKTDVDDIHSIAAVATMLDDARLAGVRYHAVAGAYGTQGGLYIPANELFEAAFGDKWSDAHTDFEGAVDEVAGVVMNTLNSGGDVWIAEAGQSDFSAALIKNVKLRLQRIDTERHIHIVQHSEWNESSTYPDNLDYVRKHASYNKIPDGNAVGNGTPGFRVNNHVNIRQYITRPELLKVWDMAIQIANRYNGSQNRYTNAHIKNGGMDFSDAAETCWIFGFDHLRDAWAFFEEFATPSE